VLNDNIQLALSYVRAAFVWAPDWVAGIALLIFALVVALLAHRLLMGAARHTLRGRADFLSSLIAETRRPTRVAFAVFALAAALQAAPFEPEVKEVLTLLLIIAFVILVGWVAHTAVEIACDLYLRRFRLDTDDNLLARKHITQVRILKRAVDTLIVVITIGAALMTFEPVRQYGVSLFASAGVAGLIVGLAARPLLSNLIGGFQIAVTQPIRLDDVVIVEGEWGRVKEITSTYVVLRLWDERDFIVPLTYFMEKPFQNWTRDSAGLIGTVLIYTDYTVPLERLREKLDEIVKGSTLWDGRVAKLQMTEAKESTIELRAIVSARNSGDAWDLRCEVREKLIEYLQREYPAALPRRRNEVVGDAPAVLAAPEHRDEPAAAPSR
jgi:small-conductance mechanosensitive channel